MAGPVLMTASFNGGNTHGRAARAMMDLASRTVWQAPGRFAFARTFGPAYSLRCIVFHDVSTAESPFTKGMGVSIPPSEFEAVLKFLVRYYTPVSLEDVLAGVGGRKLPQRAVLLTFDDGYASVAPSADLCRKLGVPAVLFLNAAFLDNKRLAPDNLVCYVANVLGMDALNRAVRAIKGSSTLRVRSMADVFQRLFPLFLLEERQEFLNAVAQLAGINESTTAGQANLYLTTKQVRDLASAGFEIGNHTYSHVHCRSLAASDFTAEIDRNKSELEAIAGKRVRSFSVPYGSSADLKNELIDYLTCSGCKAAFLSESAANPPNADPLHVDRVSVHTGGDSALFRDIEILPRLRAIRNRLFRPSMRRSERVRSKPQLALTRAEHPAESCERTQI